MYCKNCGKQIPDDSKFCPNCGHKLQETKFQETNVSNRTDNDSVGATIIGTISKHKYIALGYCLWFFIHLALLASGDSVPDYCRHHFYPFDTDKVRYYDSSEFVTYVFVIPLIVFMAIWAYKKLKASSNSNQK